MTETGEYFTLGPRITGCGICGWWWYADKPKCDCPRESMGVLTITHVDREAGVITITREPKP